MVQLLTCHGTHQSEQQRNGSIETQLASSPEPKSQVMLRLNCGQTKPSAISLSGHN